MNTLDNYEKHLGENARYLDTFLSWHPGYKDLVIECRTKGERKGVIARMKKDLKKENYPKGITTEISRYLDTLV